MFTTLEARFSDPKWRVGELDMRSGDLDARFGEP